MANKGSKRAKLELEQSDRFYGYGYVDGIEEEESHIPSYEGYWNGYKRNDPLLVKAVKALGELANGEHASLKVVKIPDEVDWYIDEYDGLESIHQQHQSWR